MVMAYRACSMLMRSCSPSTVPVAVVRLTAHHAVNKGLSGVMGASECMAVVKLWVQAQCAFEGIQGDFGGFITIGVDMHLYAGAVVFCDDVHQFAGRKGCPYAIGRTVMVAGPQ